MKLTTRQIHAARMVHARRLKVLQEDLGCPDDHPMVAWHLQQLLSLDSREVQSRGGSGTAGPKGAEDKEEPGEALAP